MPNTRQNHFPIKDRKSKEIKKNKIVLDQIYPVSRKLKKIKNRNRNL